MKLNEKNMDFKQFLKRLMDFHIFGTFNSELNFSDENEIKSLWQVFKINCISYLKSNDEFINLCYLLRELNLIDENLFREIDERIKKKSKEFEKSFEKHLKNLHKKD